MSGNVQEWCADWYDADYYHDSPAVDPQGPASGEYHCYRGGDYRVDGTHLRCAKRQPTGVGPGIRPARSLPPMGDL